MRLAVVTLLMAAIGTAPLPVHGISIHMHPASSLAPCSSAVPPFTPVDIRVMVHMEGALADGISGAEFYIAGLENLTGVQINYSPSTKLNPARLGDPFKPQAGQQRRAAFGFQRSVQECRDVTEYELIFTMTLFVTTTPIPPDTHIRIVAANPPGSPAFNCPVVTLCNKPTFTKVCVHGGEFVLNPVNDTCSNPTTDVFEDRKSATWSVIKDFYRD